MKNLKWSQVALTNFPYYKYSLKYTLDSLERIGAHNIEFYAAYPHLYLGDVSLADIKAIKKMLDDHHLQVINFCPENCTYPVNAASTNAATRYRSIAHSVTAIQAASEFESPNALFFPGYALMDENQEDAWKRAVDTMGYLAGIAEAYGVRLILESAGLAATVMNSAEKQMQMIREVGSPNVSGMVDLTCMRELGEDIEHCIATLGIENIHHIHFHNCVELTPGRWEHRVPTDGVLDIAHIVHALDDAGFKGHFGCEVFGPYVAEPEKAMLSYKKWFETMDLIRDI